MELQALHAIARKLLGNDSIRKEVFKVLKDEPEFMNLDDNPLQPRFTHHLRQRRPNATIICAPDDIEPHADTLTEPGSPRLEETLEVSTNWQHELQGEPGARYRVEEPPHAVDYNAGNREHHRNTLGDILRSFVMKAINSLGALARGAYDFMRSSAQMCARMIQNVADWFQRCISNLQARLGAVPRWQKLSFMAFAVVMSIVGMIAGMG